jgi:osmotically-inducible protein OsmY
MNADEKIKQKIIEDLAKEASVDMSKVKMSVKEGNVVLEGETTTLLGKLSATNIAQSTQGVRAVNNQLQIRVSSKMNVPADEIIEDNLRLKMAGNPEVNVLNLDVSVKGGEAVLRGTVEAYWKKVYVESLIASEPGITSIKDHLAVTPTDDASDQVIANNIVNQLEQTGNVEARDVTVAVKEGQVTLTGHVASREACQAANDAALFSVGVKGVENRLFIGDA